MDKKHQKWSNNRGFPHLRPPKIFFSKIGLCHFCTLIGLQVKGGGVFDREFTKSLIIRDFDDVLKNPFRYVRLFLLHTLLSKKNP